MQWMGILVVFEDFENSGGGDAAGESATQCQPDSNRLYLPALAPEPGADEAGLRAGRAAIENGLSFVSHRKMDSNAFDAQVRSPVPFSPPLL